MNKEPRRGISRVLAPIANFLLSRRTLIALGLALFALGASLLGLGLYNYWQPSDTGTSPEAVVEWESEPPIALPPAAQGSDTAVEVTPSPTESPIPAPATPQPVASPTAPTSFAGSMVIEAIGVEAPVIALGLDANNLPEVPRTGYEVAWYDFSSAPGTGSNAVFSGHVTWQKKGAVFWNLKKLKAGDTIKLISADGKILVYEVFASFAVEPTVVDVMYPTDEDIITIITCDGTWVPNPSERFGGHYTDRRVVQARLVSG